MPKEDPSNRPDKCLKLLLFSLCIATCVVIGWIRFLTGPDLALSLFYLLPILAAVWYVGRTAGVLAAFCSAASWLVADLHMLHAFSNPRIPFINETFRLVVFLIIVFVADKLKRALEDQKALARSDPLTQVANRRGFAELAEREIEKAHRNQEPMPLVYLDIDAFKDINDRFGHAGGDTLLHAVAETLKKNVRAVDIVARMGGDEFCVFLGETHADAAQGITQKLKELLMNTARGKGLPATFSFGVATFENPPRHVDDLVSEADRVMYAAKKEGKNRICAAVVNPASDEP